MTAFLNKRLFLPFHVTFAQSLRERTTLALAMCDGIIDNFLKLLINFEIIDNFWKLSINVEIIDNLQKFIYNFWKLSKKFQKLSINFQKLSMNSKIIDNFKFIDNFKKLSIIPSHMARAYVSRLIVQ